MIICFVSSLLAYSKDLIFGIGEVNVNEQRYKEVAREEALKQIVNSLIVTVSNKYKKELVIKDDKVVKKFIKISTEQNTPNIPIYRTFVIKEEFLNIGEQKNYKVVLGFDKSSNALIYKDRALFKIDEINKILNIADNTKEYKLKENLLEKAKKYYLDYVKYLTLANILGESIHKSPVKSYEDIEFEIKALKNDFKVAPPMDFQRLDLPEPKRLN
jgi:hypothetical protein